MARVDSKNGSNNLHWHDGSTCHGAPSAVQCLEDAIDMGWIGKVLKKIDINEQGQTVECFSMIVSSFTHWEKQGTFVAETYIASRTF